MSIKCKVYGSYLYCFDKENEKTYVFPKQDVLLTNCPESVIKAFIKEDFDAEIIFKNNNLKEKAEE